MHPFRPADAPLLHRFTSRILTALLTAAAFLLLPAILPAQSLQLAVQPETADHSPTTFSLEEGAVDFAESSVRFLESGAAVEDVDAWGVSADLTVVGIVKRASGGMGQALVMSSAGDTLLTYDIGEIPPGDESLAVYPSGNGSLWVRRNVSSFTRYDVFGQSSVTASGGVQGEGGATMPRVASDPAGKTMVIYNTQLKTASGSLGSGAQLVTAGGEMETIYYSEERTLSYLDVSDDGQFIVAVTERRGENDQVRIMDRYGNTIATISSDEELTGANVGGDAEYLVAWTESRAIVFTTADGERVRSASFGDPLFHAQYYPEDETIVGLTGNFSQRTGLMNGVGFYAIHLSKGEIASAKLGSSLGFAAGERPEFRPRFRRTSAGSYLLLGASKRVEIDAQF